MKAVRLAVLSLLAAVPAVAQTIIIPLERQPQETSTPAPLASAPPVAPPTAEPTKPDTAIVRGEGGQQEEAYQPPPK